MKKQLILLTILSSLALAGCKQTSENQGYDSGPTTKSEKGSGASGNINSDTTTTTNETE